jgi:plasmid stabilization system protein ParE
MECKYSYRFTEKAEQDFDEILRYIAFDLANPIAAQNLGKKIFEKIDIVRTFPDSGAPIDNEFLSDKEVRKLSVDNYILYYKTHHETRTIFVVRIVYGKRNLDEILKTM